MTDTNLERELLDLERQYWQAIKDQDVDAAMRLTHEPCVVTGAQGVGSVDHKMMGQMLKAAPYTLHAFELKDAKVLRLDDHTAILAYRVHEELTVDNKPVTLDAADASTWVRRDGRWLCALHTESVLGDPFARDRASSAVRVTKKINASVERVFDAWTDPKIIAQWMRGPSKEDEIVGIKSDAKKGGSFSFRVRRRGKEMNHLGDYVTFDRPKHLEFSWDVDKKSEPPLIVSVHILPMGTGSELRLTHDGIPAEYRAIAQEGWTKIVDAIAAALT